MKLYQLVFATSFAISLASCNTVIDTEGEGLTEGHTCSRCCSSTCDKGHAYDVAGDFDFAMNSVCQASCGVSDYDKSDIVDITEAKVGDITMCPVSGAIYKVKESSPILEHDGETFHSCCAGCAKKFNEDPDRFYKNV